MHLSANWEIDLFNEKLKLNLVCEMKVLFRHHHLHHYMLIIITMGGHIENVTIVTLDMVVVHCTHVWLALLGSIEPKEVISTICLYSFILSE